MSSDCPRLSKDFCPCCERAAQEQDIHNALVDLVREAAPLKWAASGDMDAAARWEKLVATIAGVLEPGAISNPTAAADAALIAAAPELYEALATLLTVEVADPGHVHTLAAQRCARDALAKAKGER